MSAWLNIIGAMDTALVGLLGGIQVTFTPNGGAPQLIKGLIMTPAMLENLMPGFNPGASVVRLFVGSADMAALDPIPQTGDTITIDTVVYVIQEPNVDVVGGAVLNLRIT